MLPTKQNSSSILYAQNLQSVKGKITIINPNQSTGNEICRRPTDVIDEENSRNSHDKVDNSDDTSGKQADGSALEANFGKSCRSVINYSV